MPSADVLLTGPPHATPLGAESVLFLAVFLLLLGCLALAPARRGRPPRSGLGAFALAVMSIVLVEAALQAYAAWYFASYPRAYEPHPDMVWKPAAIAEDGDFSRRVGGGELLPKAAGELRVLCLGDSATLHAYDDSGGGEDRSYPRQLERVLRERTPGRTLRVLNAAVAGYSSFQGVRLLEELAARCQPDLVVVAFGYWDSRYGPTEDERSREGGRAVQGLRGLLYRSQIYLLARKHLVDTREAPSDHGLQASQPRVSLPDYQDNLRRMKALCDGAGSRMLIVSLPLNPAVQGGLRARYEAYLQANRAFAAEQPVVVHEPGGTWVGEAALFFEGHPNHLRPEGARRLAEELAPRVGEALGI